ncbi:ATP-binding cassette domain-containing protein [Fructilactobacillus florum]|uniref:ATP-binding cassette domain-containing protein n=1 Tax=Fructilactobacillus florum TaxID=640331 RepID=UPI00028CAA72|nr:ATP-binding cassette domain-containing protein [Fructilactobacillus florum]EKK21044.1 Duplicated ATPase component YkoD [Fructilactobacillus florum 2F]
MPNVKIDNFTFKYKNQKPLFKNMTCTFPDHNLSLLTGPSGCGKSTILKMIAGLAPSNWKTTTGKIYLGQRTITAVKPSERTPLVSMMFQDPNQQFVMQTVQEELTFALENIQVPASAIRDKITNALAFCEIPELCERQIISLSGGEKQKVVLAIMVALDSQIMLLDEPFASIDPMAKQAILAKLVELKINYHKTIIIADHDLNGYQGLADKLFTVDPQRQTVVASAPQQISIILKQHQPFPLKFSLPALRQLPTFELLQFELLRSQRLLIQARSFRFYPGVTLLTGVSGSGKSTLLKSLSRLTDYHGTILFQQRPLQKFKSQQLYHQLALVFQQAESQFLAVTVQEELELAYRHRLSTYWTTAKIQTVLTELKLAGTQDQVVYQLSGGQQKKLQVLLLLIRDPEVLLLDEPFAGLDVASIFSLEEILQKHFSTRGRSLIIVSHQLTEQHHFFQYHVHLQQQHLSYQEGLL